MTICHVKNYFFNEKPHSWRLSGEKQYKDYEKILIPTANI